MLHPSELRCTRIQAILGRIRTPDPGPGHIGLGFDSGSELKSASTDPGPCAALTHSRILISVENSDFLTVERNRILKKYALRSLQLEGIWVSASDC